MKNGFHVIDAEDLGEREYTACRSTAKSGSSKKCCCTNRVKNLNI